MLPEIGASELLVIAAVALIVVGPKDLPVLLRRVGQIVGKLRAMAAEFRSSFDEMARQSELDDLRKEVEQMRAARGDMFNHDTFHDIHSGLNDAPAAAKRPHDAAAEGAAQQAALEALNAGVPPPAREPELDFGAPAEPAAEMPAAPGPAAPGPAAPGREASGEPRPA